MQRLALPDELLFGRLYFGHFDDFLIDPTDGDYWTLATTVDGTAAVGDAVGGRLTLTSAAVSADNEAALVHSTNELFLFAEDKPLYFGARLQYTETNTDDCNIFMGVSSVVTAAGLMQDDGAGPAATMDGVGFEKRDGETQWRAFSSFATTQTSTLLSAANSLDGQGHTAGGSAFAELEIRALPKTATLMDVQFFIDGTLVAKHVDVTMTTPEEMHHVLLVKDGSATNEEISVYDYTYCYQKR